MSREVRRVPLDFAWPLHEVWKGYLMPDGLQGLPCTYCTTGLSRRGQELHDLWYGTVPFEPQSIGSRPLTSTSPAVLALAERNVARAPEYYGRSRFAVSREAHRLADLFNRRWMHHLSQDDVDALVAGGRLQDFTHRWTKESGWQAIDPPPTPTAAEVNEWSLRGLGHDAISAWIVVRARCEREGVSPSCATCDGHSSLEAYDGQREEAEAWQPDQPPTGEGWQLWETVTEGSPVSPVHATAEHLAQWLTTTEGGHASGPSRRPMTLTQARNFVAAGWAPSGFVTAGGVHDGAHYVGAEEILREYERGDK